MNNRRKLPPISDILAQPPISTSIPLPTTTTTTTPTTTTTTTTRITSATTTSTRSNSISNVSATSSNESHPNSSVTRIKPKNRKRQRKKFEDVKRLYYCDYQNCNKGYGSLTHLNEHRVIQRHGPRKKIDDFKHVKLAELQEKKQQQQQQRQKPSPPTIIKLPLLNLANNLMMMIPTPTTSLSNYHYPLNYETKIQPTPIIPIPHVHLNNNNINEPRFIQRQLVSGNNVSSHVINGDTPSVKIEENEENGKKDTPETDIIVQSLLKMKNQRSDCL